MTAAIAKADADLFAAVFNRCDADTVAAMLTDDFRFVHDKDGEVLARGIRRQLSRAIATA